MASTSRPGSSVPVGVRSRRRFRVRRTCRRTRTPRGRAVDTDRTTPRRPATPAGSPRTRCEPPPDTLPATSAGSHPSSVARNVSGRIVERSSPHPTIDSRRDTGITVAPQGRDEVDHICVIISSPPVNTTLGPGHRRGTGGKQAGLAAHANRHKPSVARLAHPARFRNLGSGPAGSARPRGRRPGSGRTGADPRPGWPNTAVPPRSSRKRKRPPRRRHVVAAPLASHRSRP